VYVVNEKPNTENGFKAVGSNDRYFGVFNVNLTAPAYTATYNYTGNPFVTPANETGIKLFKRIDNGAIEWVNANAIQNTTANTFTAKGQNTEYILGLPCGDIEANISAGGPVNFCEGGSVILTSSAASGYLWSNGATTRSITVTDAGSYTVTVTNTAGCTLTSSAVNVTTNFCPQHKPGSGNALCFDGADDYVDIGPQFTYQNFTVDMWVKPGASQVMYADIIDNSHSDYQNWVCQLDEVNTNKYHFGASTGPEGIVSHFSLTANVWQHLTLVKSATALETYVNGILSESTPWHGTINFAEQFLRLGNWGYGGRNWKGSMDEVRIWNIPLTQSQIRERMCRKINASDPLFDSLVAYYNFDESTGVTVVDGTVDAANGTLINNTARITSGAAIGNASAYNYVTTGLPAASLSFNGQDNLGVAYTGGTYAGQAGTHVYVVNEKPNTENGIPGVGSNDRYFGVFNVNLTALAYTATYNYNGNPFVTPENEADISLFKRTNNGALQWENANANLNAAARTLTVAGQNTEYMLGVLHCGNATPACYRKWPSQFLPWGKCNPHLYPG
jgi:hypothetical protein